jgi:hypothetical protein
VAVDDLAPDRLAQNSYCRADAYAHERETRDTWSPAAMLGEDDGIGDERQVEDSVYDRNPRTMLVVLASNLIWQGKHSPEVEEPQDGLCEGEHEGPGQVELDELPW